jgi:hypothetical protein
VIERAEERLRRRQEKEIGRKTATRKLRLPGKLADCTQNAPPGHRDLHRRGRFGRRLGQAGARPRHQAVLPLRGKILNVASAGRDKLAPNQQIADLIQALGCGTRDRYREDDLRYDRVIIMTDADVDGAHIASLLITFFYQEMPELIDAAGHLYLAVPPLYRISRRAARRLRPRRRPPDELLKTGVQGQGKVEVGRFKGLGEMMPAQLKETTMDPSPRRSRRTSASTASNHKLTVALLIGGVSFDEQDKKLDRGVDVLIATPGRLLDHFERGKLLLTGVEILVIDEADRMLDMGFIPDIERICKLLPHAPDAVLLGHHAAGDHQARRDSSCTRPGQGRGRQAGDAAEDDHAALVASRAASRLGKRDAARR